MQIRLYLEETLGNYCGPIAQSVERCIFFQVALPPEVSVQGTPLRADSSVGRATGF